MRKAGDVCFAQVFRERDGRFSINTLSTFSAN